MSCPEAALQTARTIDRQVLQSAVEDGRDVMRPRLLTRQRFAVSVGQQTTCTPEERRVRRARLRLGMLAIMHQPSGQDSEELAHGRKMLGRVKREGLTGKDGMKSCLCFAGSR